MFILKGRQKGESEWNVIGTFKTYEQAVTEQDIQSITEEYDGQLEFDIEWATKTDLF